MVCSHDASTTDAGMLSSSIRATNYRTLMPYIIETWDKPDSKPIRASARPAHLEFLAAHAGKLIYSGAKLHDDGSDLGGSIYVLDTEDRSEAEAFIAADPFSKAELFERVTITRLRKAYIAGRCYL
jgi:uncharacterized protein